MASAAHRPSLPAVVVPGFMSSCLQVEESALYPEWVDSRVWLSMKKLGFQAIHFSGVFDDASGMSLKNKWLEHLCLKGPEEEMEGIRVRAVPGVAGVDFLDPDSLFGLIANSTFVFGPVVEALKQLDYREGTNMFAASYDWRLAPMALESRDEYFKGLRSMIEEADQGQGVVLIAHSMGNKTVPYFLKYMMAQEGQQWVDEHIHAWVAAGAPLMGAAASVKATLLGDCMGLEGFMTLPEAVVLGRSFSSSPWLFPLGEQAHGVLYLRREGMLEVIIQSGDLSRCHIESIKNKIIVNVEVCWGDGREKIVLKSHSCDEFDGTTAKWDADINLLQFGCPAVLPENATIQVIVKEKGIRDDHHVNPFVRLGKGLVGGVQILEEAVQGRGTKGLPRGSTGALKIRDLCKPSHDWVQRRQPLKVASRFGFRSEEGDIGHLEFSIRWRDSETLRRPALKMTAPKRRRHADPVPVEWHLRHVKRDDVYYDIVDMHRLVELEDEGIAQVWQKYYVEDPLYDEEGVDDCPPSRRLMSIHGVDRATQIAYALRINTGVTKRKSTETRFCLDQDADIIDGNASVSIKGGIICEQKGGATPSGDGTVPLASLEHCLKWKDTIDVRLSRLRDAEHRGMLAEPQFHMAIADALTPNYWSQGIQWVPVCRGDRLALGGVFVGTTATDGDVYVARNPQGESGKLNCDKDKVWNIWCHQNGSSQVGDMLVVPGGAIVRWLPIKRGDEIPLAAVFVGYTPNDGPVYVARAKGECGKLNCDNGLAWNIWCHQSGVTTEGEILTVEASSSTPEPRQWFGAGKKGEWRPFSPDIVKILNEAYGADRGTLLVDIDARMYKMDLEAMIQTTLDTGTKRPILVR